MRHITQILLSTVVLALSACGGGGGGGGISTQPTMLSVTGIAATGLAIPSAGVSAKCQSGNGSATTTATGAYSLVISGGAMPCMLEVTNPADGTKLHSVATGSGTSAVANITPLTELVTSRLLGQDPLAYYSALSAGNLSAKITPSGISAAQADVVLAFTGTIDTAGISNFISTPMVAATLASPASGDAQDKILDLIRLKLNSTQVSQIAALLANGTDASAIKTSVISTVAATNTYSISGVVSGLTGSNSVTLLNGADNTVVASGNGVFIFSTPVVYNGNYAVTVGRQPIGQTCTVGSGSGSGVVANVINVSVTCSNITYTVSGTVSGLTSGNSVTILNNAGNATTVSANVAFTFSTPVAYSGSYAVTVGTQPIGQTCTVSRGSGSGVVANVSDLAVTCSNITYTVGGSVSGLGAGNQVTLQNNASNATTVSANGGFTFSIPVAYKGSYLVTVGTQPTGQTCTVNSGSGSGMVANISNVTVSCSNITVGVYRVANQNTTQFNRVFNYAVGDLNGDGLDDVVIGGWTGTGTSYISVLIQNQEGTLTDRTTELIGSNQYPGSMHIFINDFDGDGFADIWFPGGDDLLPSAASVMLWGSASGKFTRQKVDNGIASHGGCVADLNADGNLDMLVTGAYDQQINNYGYYLNNGNRTFSNLVPSLDINGASSCAVIRDPTTGHLAVVQGGNNQMAGYESSISIVDASLNLIKRIGITKQDTSVAGLITAIPVDVNGDGLLDLVLAWESMTVGWPNRGRKEVWFNQGNDNFVFGYTLDTAHNMPGGWVSFTYKNELYVFFDAPGGDAVLYRRESGKLVPYKSESFTAMLTALGADPVTGAWLGAYAVGSGTVYRGRDSIYMLQNLASGLYTKKL